jgi:hypothetical protein
MTSRFLASLFISLLLCATAHANTLPTGMAATSMSVDLHLVACHATLAGLTALGMALGMRRRPESPDQGEPIRAN